MSAAALQNLGLVAGWVLGEEPWGDEMNANLRALDALAQLRILDKDLTAPPGAPAAGDVYIVGTGATGAWATHDGEVTRYSGTAWAFYAPKSGWSGYVVDEGASYLYTGSAWVKLYLLLNSIVGAANGIATLGSDGKLPSAQIPSISIVDFLGTVASQAAMLALTGQKGDWAKRSDTSSIWVISGTDPTNIASWTEWEYPAAPTTEFYEKQVACSDYNTTALAVGEVAGFRSPTAFTVTAVRAALRTAQSSGSTFTVDIKKNGTSILSTLLTLDNAETTSVSAAVAAVISTSAITDDDLITIHVTQIGDGTAKGLTVTLIGTRAI